MIAHSAVAQELTPQAALEQRFKQLDKNGDGKITTDEVPPSPFFTQRDKNGDGVITLAEATAELTSSTVPKPTSIPSNANQPTPAAKVSPRVSSSSKARRSPQQLKAADHGVGRLVADVAFKDIAGGSQKLSLLTKQQPLVVAMTSTSCPISKKYLPTLAQLAKSYSERGIKWVLVNPISTDTSDDMRAAKKSIDQAIYVHDREGNLTCALGALTTTDVIVLDASRTVVFHGAIDDQYGLGYSIDAPRHRYLADALDAILSNKPPPVAATDAPGCLLAVADQPPTHPSITYHNRISRIVQHHCLECHRTEGVAPFSLATHQDLMSHGGMIKQVVGLETMPPWFAKPHEAGSGKENHGLWANDRSLTVADKQDLLKWIDGGGPMGDERDAPQPVSFHKSWQIGKPDAVFQFAEAVPIKATGTMPYQNVVIETNLADDKWIQAIEIQPGDRSVVHHMVVYLLAAERDQLSLSDEAADERNGYWAIYVPGNGTLAYPDGFAKPLPKNAKLRCQVHYTPSGKATTDLSRIGVVFAKAPPRHEVRVVGVGNPRIAIPPGAENHREDGSLRLPFDIHVLGFLPHMHVRGKACRYKAVSSSGDARTLLDIPHYDFNWQLLYRYAEPVPVLRGESLKLTAWYDNSAKNPANPDPTQTVRWGKQTNDEMHLGYVEYYIPSHAPGKPNEKSDPKRR